MADLITIDRAVVQQALDALCLWSAGHELDAIDLNNLIDRLEAALEQQAEPVEPVACSNTFDCQCPKHFASQQSEQRPKRVLTAVWRDRAQRAEAQRDALLAALENAVDCWQTEGLLTDGHVQAMLAAIAKAGGGGNG